MVKISLNAAVIPTLILNKGTMKLIDYILEDPSCIGARLKELREVQGYTQQSLGVAIGIAQTTLSHVEAGGRGQAVPANYVGRYVKQLKRGVEVVSACKIVRK